MGVRSSTIAGNLSMRSTSCSHNGVAAFELGIQPGAATPCVRRMERLQARGFARAYHRCQSNAAACIGCASRSLARLVLRGRRILGEGRGCASVGLRCRFAQYPISVCLAGGSTTVRAMPFGKVDNRRLDCTLVLQRLCSALWALAPFEPSPCRLPSRSPRPLGIGRLARLQGDGRRPTLSRKHPHANRRAGGAPAIHRRLERFGMARPRGCTPRASAHWGLRRSARAEGKRPSAVPIGAWRSAPPPEECPWVRGGGADFRISSSRCLGRCRS